MLGQEPQRCERHFAEAGTTTATHRRKCYSGRTLTMRFVMLSVGSLFRSIRVVQCTIDYTGHVLHARCTVHPPCPIQTRFVLSLCLTRPCTFVVWFKPSRFFQLSSHGKVSVDLCAWTPRYARCAVARTSDRYCRERHLFTVLTNRNLCLFFTEGCV